jgi:hypothetical protein
MGRNLGSIPLVEVQNNVNFSYLFARVDVASPVGTKRYSEAFFGDFTGNIDGSSQLWSAADFLVGGLNQSAQNVTSVSSISFANISDAGTLAPWTGWAITPGLRGAKVQIWVAYFDRSTLALIDKVKLFEGTIDSGEFGDRATMAVAPYVKPWSRQVPAITGMMLGAAPLMPDPTVTIRWVDAVGSIVGYTPAPNTSGSSSGTPPPKHRAVTH